MKDICSICVRPKWISWLYMPMTKKKINMWLNPGSGINRGSKAVTGQ